VTTVREILIAQGAITAEVVAWAKDHRFDTRQEVEAVATKRKPCGRNIGLLDVVCTHPSGQQIAVEVDFTNKIWSIEKLAAEADAIWVKWGGPASLSLIPEKIGVVELQAEWTNQAGHIMYRRSAHATKLHAQPATTSAA
jgi:hypothetical protein